jgi:L-aspartate oxidase
VKRASTDVLVIGSGIAGLSYALKAAQHGSVAVITKKQRADSSTNRAQGGIAAVMAPDDSVTLHVRDTVVAGAGLCSLPAVQMLAAEGPARVRDLMEWGVAFTQEAGSLSLGREGGHSRRRIVHATDLTGREIERALLAAVGDDPAILLHEDFLAVDLLVGVDERTGRPRCYGAEVLDHRSGERVRFDAHVVMLASGGFGQAYLHTTNPDIATGDGVAMAYRAGALIANLEFVQFHPTALYPAEGGAFLISEAIRGEGAVLRAPDGSPLMEGVHPLGSLAPRDVVAREIDRTLKHTGAAHVWLDLAPIGAATIERRFPGILNECSARGIDIRRELVPVVPAAHYACGGVLTDARGRTTLSGLFAAGEVACTGVHGANRLASNSLLEAVVYAHHAAGELPLELLRAGRAGHGPGTAANPADDAPAGTELEAAAWQCRREEIRRVMWSDAGIIRSTERLDHALDVVTRDLQRIEETYNKGTSDAQLIELRNLAEVARLVVHSARQRRESRGMHTNIDFAYRDNVRFLRNTLVQRDGFQETSA